MLTADKDVIMDTLNAGQLVMSLAIGRFVNNLRAQIVHEVYFIPTNPTENHHKPDRVKKIWR